MFDVLAYVYNHYRPVEEYPEPTRIAPKLRAVGFTADEISEAMEWLQHLNAASSDFRCDSAAMLPNMWLRLPRKASTRVFSRQEMARLGPLCSGWLHALDVAGALPMAIRELALDRIMGNSQHRINLDELKLTILLAYWSCSAQPSPLMLDELCTPSQSVRILQ
ncbi:DUF494 domain-containing protein [Curvibacter sp. CHRR-16]|uniref:DUF494 domain-containing protein n=1 Tax=Curvibacter sp. CHRR-16 TaxID=2835872 RepID=UPI001BDB4EAE|nr:DUF494 domain-containing protein [Curvibacter sp. CHRR-16]MBT0570436.1 DUF494 domain-containing protein [Curvibacter sp. CHRR-16]